MPDPLATSATAPGVDPEHLLLMELPTGRVWIALLPEVAPRHVERILTLTRDGAYDSAAFHRVIAGFMAQTGDVEFGRLGESYNPQRVGTGGSSYPNLAAEFSDLPFERGVLGMARAGHPDSADSQFFITYDDAPWLDGQYTVFGVVVDGMTHVDALKAGPRAANGAVPGTPDGIVSMTVAEDAGLRAWLGSGFAESVWALEGLDSAGNAFEGALVFAFRDCSIQHADPAKRIRRKVVFPAATQHSARERIFAKPPAGRIYTGHLPHSHDPTGLRTWSCQSDRGTRLRGRGSCRSQ